MDDPVRALVSSTHALDIRFRQDQKLTSDNPGSCSNATCSEMSSKQTGWVVQGTAQLEGLMPPCIPPAFDKQFQFAHFDYRSIARNVGMSVDALKDEEVPVEHPKERKLAKTLLRFPEVISTMLEELHVHPLCDYLFELSQTFSEFYDNCYCIEKDKATGEEGAST